MKIVFFGTPEFALPSLRRLLESRHRVVAGICQPDKPGGRGLKSLRPPVSGLCEQCGIALRQPDRLTKEEMKALFAETGAEAGVVVAYGRLLRQWLLDVPKLGFINVHASLLPRHRGASPIARAIIAGDEVTGVSIMKLDAGMDTGPVYASADTPIGREETAGELAGRLAAMGGELLVKTLDALEAGGALPVPQEGEATLAPPLSRDDGRIDWTRPAKRIHDLVRGVNPWPGAFAGFRGRELRLWKTAVAPEGSGSPGEILAARKNLLRVAAGAGALDLLELQWPGKKRLGPSDFINGARVTAGQYISSQGEDLP